MMHSLEEKVGSTKGRFGEWGWKKRIIAELFTVDGIAGEIRKTTNGINTERKFQTWLLADGERSSIREEKPKAGRQFFFHFSNLNDAKLQKCER